MHVKSKSTNSDLCGNMETPVMFSLLSPSFYNQATSSIVRRFFTSHLKFLFPTVLVLFAITVFPFTRCLLFPILVLFAITPFLFTKNHNPTTETKNNNNIPKKFPLPPGPKPWPFLGSLPEMLKNKPAYRWILNLMAEMNTEIISICLGKVRVVVVTCPKIGREFLKTQDAIFSSRPLTMASQITSGGYLSTILVPFGPQWKKMKRIMTREVLSPARHHWLHQKRIEEADHLVHYVYNQFKDPKKCGLVNVRLAAQHYCGNVTRKMVFNKRFFGEGTKDGGPGFEEEEHVNAIFTILAYLFSFSISDYFPFLVDLDLDGHKKVVKKANAIIGKYHDPIIEERAKQWKDGTRIEVEDLLDVLITSKDENGNNLLSKEEIKATITEIMIAAVDNPSNAAEWALAEMINQPETLEKAIEELDRVVGKERLVQESDFSQLNYVKACAKEAFRLHPIAPFIPPHVSMADTTASGYSIPKGSHVLLSRKGIGRNPNVWDEPLKFKPERHLKNDGSEVVLTDHDLNLISFSTGRRGCPGIALGTSMTTMLFARLLQCFTWSPPPGESSIDLSESKDCLALAKPLLAIAKPRLATNIYQV